MTRTAIFRSPAGAAAVDRAYEEFLRQELPEVEARHLPTSLGPTYVISAGPPSAPPVVLLPGSGGTALNWARELRGGVVDYRLHAVDLPGEPGRTAPVRMPLDSPDHARWLTELTDALAARPALVVGASLGGFLATDYAIRRPERVTGLLLISPSGLGRRRIAPLLVAAALGQLGDRGRRAALGRLLGPGATLGSDLTADRLGRLALLIFAHFRPRTDRLPRFDDRQLAGLRAPVHLVCGAEDALLGGPGTVRRAERLIPHCHAELLPQIGHLIPDQLARVYAFLDDRRG